MAITLLIKMIIGASFTALGATTTSLGIVYQEQIKEFFGITTDQVVDENVRQEGSKTKKGSGIADKEVDGVTDGMLENQLKVTVSLGDGAHEILEVDSGPALGVDGSGLSSSSTGITTVVGGTDQATANISQNVGAADASTQPSATQQ